MDCLGLAVTWEDSKELRTRIREEKRVLVYGVKEKYCQPNRQNAVENAGILKPVLIRLGQHPKHTLPHLDDLIVEVTTLYSKCGLSTDNKAPYKTSVEIKKLAGFIKSRSRRKEVTKDMSWCPNALGSQPAPTKCVLCFNDKPKDVEWQWMMGPSMQVLL
eukprot:Skav226725  [mRNA]  locus=scaffold720:29792:30271:- [translate_table: standard]